MGCLSLAWCCVGTTGSPCCTDGPHHRTGDFIAASISQKLDIRNNTGTHNGGGKTSVGRGSSSSYSSSSTSNSGGQKYGDSGTPTTYLHAYPGGATYPYRAGDKSPTVSLAPSLLPIPGCPIPDWFLSERYVAVREHSTPKLHLERREWISSNRQFLFVSVSSISSVVVTPTKHTKVL